jgi:LysR family transcriptional regulator, hydrogen peroxide-inducible genes activator
MEIQQLKYVIAVAEAGNFTRAAEKCFVAQPSLSQSIILLEKELGHRLFHRLGRKAVPTEAGAAFLENARRILYDVENTVREMRDEQKVGSRVTVGAIPTIAPYLMPQLLDRCRTEHPNLTVHTREDFRTPLANAVLEGELDMALISMPYRDARLVFEPLFTEPLLLVVGLNHPLAKKEPVTAKDLAHETFILLGDSSSLTLQVQRFWGDHDVEPKIGYRCSQVATVKSLVSLGLGISILPQVTRKGEDRRTMAYRELSGRSPVREIALVRHPQRYQSRGAAQFLSLLRESLQPLRSPFS